MMFKKYEVDFLRFCLYTSMLTTLSWGSLYAMDGEEAGPLSRPQRSFSQQQIQNAGGEVLEEYAQLITNASGTPYTFSSENELIKRGQEVIGVLALISPLRSDGSRYEEMRAKKRTKDLNEENRTKTRGFFKFLQSSNFTDEQLNKLSKITYGFHRLNTIYSINMHESFKKESLGDKDNQDVYASDLIDPQDTKARARFLQDALGIFSACIEFQELADSQYAKSRLTDFHSFSRLYLALVRDALGSLYARENALNLTVIDSAEEGLTEEHRKARQAFFSRHYLGETERQFQIIENLRPLAEIACKVDGNILNMRKLDDHIDYAKKLLGDICAKEHGVVSALDFSASVAAEVLPEKPLTKSQKKRQKKREKQKEKIAELKLALEESASPHPETAPTPSSSSPPKAKVALPKPVSQVETFSDWVLRTENHNLKREYQAPSERELHQKVKAEAKAAKHTTHSTPTVASSPTVTNAVSEAELPQINIKTVIHSPHKNGSKKLRPYHVSEIRRILNEGGYTLTAVTNKGSKAPETKRELSGNSWKVFYDIQTSSYSGEMNDVTHMLQALGGFVDETRSGSRIGILLRHISTNEIIGTDLASYTD